VDPDRTSVTAQQLRDMRGSTAVTNIGMQIEYYPLSIRDFMASDGSFAPFVSLGAQFNHYSPEAYSVTGPLTILNTPVKYRDAFTNDDGNTWSVVSSVGTRYKLSPVSDLMADFRFQYYFSNWVDGLNPDPKKYPENKANDWLVWFNVGYIYYLN
ncbi:MAG TPA: glutamate dehydrogenase, partial [Flavobacterium sp.]|nr:glutamate dehydrogenase [Flavobacterium sp.]